MRGNQRIEADTVRSYMLLQPGDAFDADRLDRSLKSLYATGLFRDVRIGRDGGRVVVEVAENPIVNRVAFEGNRKISDDVLRGEAQLRGRSVFTTQAAQADRQRILELYARRGRFGAVVEPKIIELDQNRVDVVYEIQENEAALVARINFVGNRAYSDSRLKEVVATKEQAWYRIFSSSDQFDPERLAFDRELLRRFYLRSGYADVQVTGATAELAPDRTGFFVTFTLDEGARYRVGRVEVVSNLRNLDAASLRGLVQVEEGDWYDGDAVERVSQSLQDAVNLRGFPFVDVQPRIQRDRENRRVDLTFEVNEAPRVFVERIDITGNTRTQDRVIRREFRIAEGDAFNAAQIRRSRQRIRDLGYFSDVQVTSSPGLGAGPRGAEHPGDGARHRRGLARRRLLDGRRRRWPMWACASATCSAPASTRASTARWRSGAARWTSRSPTRPSSTATSPPASTSSTSSATCITIANYRERRAGFAVRAGYAFNERLRQTWAYTLTNREIFDVSQPTPRTSCRSRRARRCCRRSARPSPTTSAIPSSTRAAAAWCASARTSPASAATWPTSARGSTAPTSSRSNRYFGDPDYVLVRVGQRRLPASRCSTRRTASSTASSSAARTCAASASPAPARATSTPATRSAAASSGPRAPNCATRCRCRPSSA